MANNNEHFNGIRGRAKTASALQNPYGRFSADGREFRITNPRPPRPWVNIIANPRVGLAVSQTGSGFSWIDNSQLGVLTNWQQDFSQDCSGKFLYLRDAESGEVWSLSPAPVWAALDQFTAIHGFGFTTFETCFREIEARWTLLVHPEATAELWRVELVNRGNRQRRLELTAFLEWCCGVAPAPRREFHKLFIETAFDAHRGAVLAQSHMWDVASKRFGHWNTDFPYIAAFGANLSPRAAQGDKTAFLGRNGSLRCPAALDQPAWIPQFGRHEDPIAALRYAIDLAPAQRQDLGFVLAVGASRAEAVELLERYREPAAIDTALAESREGWLDRLAAHRIETGQPGFDPLINDWLRYQAISSRIWGRCGYYQQSGAFGFRDQLQDSQVWLTIDPARCRNQLGLHAAHQFTDGSVYHWWHPLSEQGHITRMTDDLLWLGFVTANYIRETGDDAVLTHPAPFLDDPRTFPLLDHIERAFERVFQRTSARGLPLIGAGDWNDGLSACGLAEKGESIWLGQFLAGQLADWSEILTRTGHTARAQEFAERRTALVDAINTHGWDGKWYFRATLDDGTKIGSHENSAGRIYLNAQTWSLLSDVAPPDRAESVMDEVERQLVTAAGALLLAPAYREPVAEIGYITRYAPGLRENGGVYTHAATWAIAAAAKARRPELVEKLLLAINPVIKDPERYWAEPYVLPGNVDGPDSPRPGRAGWTWYTGSAAWLHRIVCEWVLGVRPEWDGLRLAPCLPASWSEAKMVRPWRGHVYRIEIVRDESLPAAQSVAVTFDGQLMAGSLLPIPTTPSGEHLVQVRFR